MLRHLVESPAFDGDAILRPLELRLQLQEILIRFEIGIPLDDDEQSRECVAQSRLRRLELRECLRIVRDVALRSRRAAGRSLHLADA